MILKIDMKPVSSRPIITVKSCINCKDVFINAIIDTGATKAFWVDDYNYLKALSNEHLSDNGVASGFGKTPQRNMPVELIDLYINDNNNKGIHLLDLPVTYANINTNGLFSLVLPYTLFNKFEFGFLNNGEHKCNQFYLNTGDMQINYKALTDDNEQIIDVLISSENNDSEAFDCLKIKSFN